MLIFSSKKAEFKCPFRPETSQKGQGGWQGGSASLRIAQCICQGDLVPKFPPPLQSCLSFKLCCYQVTAGKRFWWVHLFLAWHILLGLPFLKKKKKKASQCCFHVIRNIRQVLGCGSNDWVSLPSLALSWEILFCVAASPILYTTKEWWRFASWNSPFYAFILLPIKAVRATTALGFLALPVERKQKSQVMADLAQLGLQL